MNIPVKTIAAAKKEGNRSVASRLKISESRRIPQDQERFRPQERAPEMSTQELATQLRELKGTVEALFDIVANAATEDNKREADSRRKEPDRQ
uniref:Uncharacterized protein n=1 Tax=Romanomermis culicivorax TaxID=13658 RepID=A0A915K2Z4_ROMCU